MPRPATILRKMIFEDNKKRYPEMPEGWIPDVPIKTSGANNVTKAVIKFLKLSGHQAERINTMGRRIDQTQTYTDVLGYKRQIGSVKWIKGTGTKGSADISATIDGRSVKIEVKWGKDRQSAEQKEYQRQVEKAGGIYIIVHTFDEFYEWYQKR